MFCDTQPIKQWFNQISCTAGMWATTLSILLLALSFCIKFYSQPSRLCNTNYTCNRCSLLLPSPLLKATNISLCIFHLCTSLWPFFPLCTVPMPSSIPDTPWIISSTDTQLCPVSDSGLLYTWNLVQSEVECKFTEGNCYSRVILCENTHVYWLPISVFLGPYALKHQLYCSQNNWKTSDLHLPFTNTQDLTRLPPLQKFLLTLPPFLQQLGKDQHLLWLLLNYPNTGRVAAFPAPLMGSSAFVSIGLSPLFSCYHPRKFSEI